MPKQKYYPEDDAIDDVILCYECEKEIDPLGEPVCWEGVIPYCEQCHAKFFGY